eukprot:GGOE01018128.1.p1 GENE.GGOE01018128.1~~GGOE01018128.1.p1  ORF type:complete len:407 (-),score=87.39 GGOE01018128.1:257-1477(-)
MSSLLARDDEVHVSSFVWRSSLWRKTKCQKLAMFRRGDEYPIGAYVLACVEIQRIFRGILLRRRVLAKYLYRRFKSPRHMEDEKVMGSYLCIDAPKGKADVIRCIQRVASRVRTVIIRAEYSRWIAHQKFGVYYVAATSIARVWRILWCERQGRPQPPPRPLYRSRRDAAAARIQSVWRSHIDRQVFRYYLDLIRLREAADARTILRVINPKEASLIDGAAPIFLRFRLGGGIFPPIVYYKVFLNAPVCDLGALAPRDYTRSRKVVSRKGTRLTPGVEASDHTGWYQRVENNDWRPVNEMDLQEAEHHATKLVQAKHGFATDSPFHFSKLVRRRNKALKLRQKKRQWMMHLYNTTSSADTSAKTEPVDECDDEQLESTVHSLVTWTQELDFEAYHRDWLRLATSET